MNPHFVNAVYRNVLLPPVRRITANDAEVAHEWFVVAMRRIAKHPMLIRALGPGPVNDPLLTQTLMFGLTFPNPFGTAAGMDKDGELYPALFALMGVGHIEVGGVTLHGQPGNPRPRVVRADKDHLINSMGFPNHGVDVIAQRLSQQREPTGVLGAQVAPNKDTPISDVVSSYVEVTRRLSQIRAIQFSRAIPDYFSINVSSPNTPGLREWQDPARLRDIVTGVCEVLDARTEWCESPRERLLLKFAPDLELAQLEELIELALEFDLGGITLTNTTISRPIESKYNARPGGFSGSVLYDRAAKMIKFAARLLPAHKTLVAVGGIDTADRAYEMLHYAQLIEGYTGLVLRGPMLYRAIASDVAARMRAEGVSSLAELRAGNRPATPTLKAVP